MSVAIAATRFAVAPMATAGGDGVAFDWLGKR
jgi:hypothetical protein